jgi:hypothetical protein
MPTIAKIAAGLAVAFVVGMLFRFWVGWPGFLAVAAAAIFGVAFLVVATSLGEDPRAADAAWREQAGEAFVESGGGADAGPRVPHG